MCLRLEYLIIAFDYYHLSLDEYHFPGKSGAEWIIVLPFSCYHCAFSNCGINHFVLGTNHLGLILLQNYRHVSTTSMTYGGVTCCAAPLLFLFLCYSRDGVPCHHRRGVTKMTSPNIFRYMALFGGFGVLFNPAKGLVILKAARTSKNLGNYNASPAAAAIS